MPKRTQIFRMLPWGGGLNTSVDPGMISPNQLTKADNIIFDNAGTRKKREAVSEFNTPAGSGDIIGTKDFWHEISTGKQQRIIAVKRTNSVVAVTIQGPTGSVDTLTEVGTVSYTPSDATKAHIEVVGNIAVLAFTGATLPKKIAFANNAAAEVTDITTVADASDSLDGKFFRLDDDVGSVGFWIDTDDSGTTIPAGASALDRAVEITTIVTDDSASTVASKIRTVINADSKFGATVNSAVITVTDASTGFRTFGNAQDSGFTFTLVSPGLTVNSYFIQELGGSPPNFSICREHLGRLWTNDADRPDFLHYSSTGNIEQWNGERDSGGINDLGVGDGDPEGITGITPTFKGQLFVGKRYSLYRITGFTPLSFAVQKISATLGIVSHGSCVAVDQDDIVYASEKGFHSIIATANFGDVASTFLSADIQPTFQDDIDKDRREFIKGEYIPTLNSIAWAVTNTDETKNETIYLYNVIFKQWYRWPKLSCESLTVVKLSNVQKLMLGEAADSPTVGKGRLVETEAANTFNDFNLNPINFDIKSGVIFPDESMYNVKAFKKLGLIFRNRGSTSLAVQFKIDDFPAQNLTFDVIGSADLLGSTFVLGTTELAGETVIAPLTLPVDGYGRGFQLSINNQQGAESTEIYGFFVEYESAGDQQESSANRQEN